MPSNAQTATGSERPYHAVTWLVWALAGTAAVQVASSPVYVVIVVGIAWLMVSAYGLSGPFARAFPILLTLGVVFAFMRVALMALTTHSGLDVLFTVPSFTLPDFLGGFTVGGTIELPVVLQAANEGLVIVGVIAVFGAFNAVTSHYELVQSAPRAFYEVGLIIVVALAFVPSTVAAVVDVREADRARTGGRVVRRGRLLRQLVPVLECGLERAVDLAESMDSRGFAHGGASPRDKAAGWCGVGSLVALASAFVALIARSTTLAAVLGLTGVAGLLVAIRLASAGEAQRALPAAPHDARRLPRVRGFGSDAGCPRDHLARRRQQPLVGDQPAALARPARVPRRRAGRPHDAPPPPLSCSWHGTVEYVDRYVPRTAGRGGRRVSAIEFRAVSFAYPDAPGRRCATSSWTWLRARCCS